MGTENRFEREKEDRKARKAYITKMRNQTWLVVCEGEKTEPFYFEGLKKFLNLKGKKCIALKSEGRGRNTEDLVKHLKDHFDFVDNCYGKVWIPYANSILVFDKDSFGAGQFNNAISKANAYKKQDSVKKVIVAWSNESFELWLCLHFEYIDARLGRHDYNDKLTRIFRKIGVFTENQNYEDHGKNLENIFDVVNTHGSVAKAIERAKRLCYENFTGSAANANPATMVYVAVEALAKQAGYEFK